MELANALESCYLDALRARDAVYASDIDAEYNAAQQWASAMHAAFYAPVARSGGGKSAARGGGSGANKFVELETALVRALTSLAQHQQQQQHDKSTLPTPAHTTDLWSFVVRVVLLLATEPSATTDAKNGAISSSKSEAVASSEPMPQHPAPTADTTITATAAAASNDNDTPRTKRKTKTKSGAQPFVPLAFVVLNALKKLSDPATTRGACVARRFQELGARDTALHAFCQQGLADPDRVDAKLLVEVLDVFQLLHVAPSHVLVAAAERFVATKSFAATIKMCSLFDSVHWPFERFVVAMAQSKDWISAELLVRVGASSSSSSQSPHAALATVLVQEAIALQELKRAHRLVHTFSLQQSFPDIESLYSRENVLKLITKRKWQLARTFVGSDAILQRLLFDHAVRANESALAADLAACLDIVDFVPDAPAADDADDDRVDNSNSDAFYKLPQSIDVVFCDTEAHVRAAHAFFFLPPQEAQALRPSMRSDSVVGLDVEWKPVGARLANTQAIASILQIATHARVFVVDLLTLHDNDYLFETFLTELFASRAFVKVGFGFDSDMRVLHQTFPERNVFRSITPFLELSTAVASAHGAAPGKSLSSAAALVLGKPLDKRMQLSNWDTRPLSPTQLQYAAIDAFCVTAIVSRLYDSLDNAASLSTNQQPLKTPIDALPTLATRVDIATTDTVEQLLHVRRAYVTDWNAQRQEHANAFRSAASPPLPTSTTLLTPRDVQRFWDTRRAAYVASNVDDARVDVDDWAITFVSAAAAHELLASRTTTADAESSFTHINSICFFADAVPCVACIDARLRLDTAALARYCRVGRRKLKLATPAECATVFGFLPGTVPPFGHGRQSIADTVGAAAATMPITVYVDAALTRTSHLLCGGGSSNAFLWLSTNAFVHVVDVECVAHIAVDATGRSTNNTTSKSVDNSNDPIDAAAVVSTTTTASNGHAPPALATAASSPSSSSKLKFVADTMASQVARWLRTIGVDVVTFDATQHGVSLDRSATTPSHRAQLIAFATAERRIILTRDTQLAIRRDAGACLVLSTDTCYKQFREVKTQFGLYARQDGSASRCAHCNATAFVAVDRAFVRERLRARVLAKVLADDKAPPRAFWMCVTCEKIYWDGPKYAAMSVVGDDTEVLYQPQARAPRGLRK